jgi:AraC-like DNA-binding protein
MTNDVQSATRSPVAEGRRERLTFFRPAAAPGTEILAAYDSFHPWRVFHERYAICACHTAAAGWRYRGKEHFLADGSSMLLEPGELHANTRIHKYSDFKVLFVEPEIFASAAHELDVSGTPHYRFAQSENPELLTAVYGFCAAVEHGADALEQQSRFAVCLRRLLGFIERAPRTPEVGSGHSAAERARAYLQEHFKESVTLNELAAVSGLSRFHLLRSFARRFGLPPHGYQVRLRVERALRLLRSGMPPSLVASAVGFADQSHLTRHLRHVMGLTPARYARQLGSNA